MSEAMEVDGGLQASEPKTPDTIPTPMSPSGPSPGTNPLEVTAPPASSAVRNLSTLFEAPARMPTFSGDCPAEIAEKFAFPARNPDSIPHIKVICLIIV